MSHFTRYIIKLIILVDVILAVCIMAEQKLNGADAWCYRVISRLTGHPADTQPQLRLPGDPVRVEKTILREHRRYYPPVFHVLWEPDGSGSDTALPLPKIQELATIVNCLAGKVGVGCVGISAPLMWEDEQDEMAHHMLTRALQGCHIALMGIPARNAARPEATPQQLLPAGIPPHQIEGDPAALPYANAPLPYTAPKVEADALIWAPDYIEDDPDTHRATQTESLSTPLLMRWKGDILPTLPLRLALAQQGLSPADVQVKLGKSIRIGKRLLPLDSRGRTPLGAARVIPLSLTEVLNAPPAPRQDHLSAAILSRPFTPDHPAERGEHLAATLSLLLSSVQEIYLPTERPVGGLLLEQNPLQARLAGRVVLASLVICALVWLPMLPRREQRIALAGLALAGIIAGIICYRQHEWLSICAWFIGWCMLLAATELLSRDIRKQSRDREFVR